MGMKTARSQKRRKSETGGPRAERRCPLTEPTRTQTLPEWLPAASAVVLVTVVAFLPVLMAGIINWDDEENITINPYLNPVTFSSVAALWTHAYRYLYIPLVLTSYAAEYALAGATAWVFHLTNLVLHACAAIVAMRILRVLVPAREDDPPRTEWAALVGALVFAVHPMQVEPVAWITGRKDVLSGLLALLTIRQYLRANHSTRPWVGFGIALIFFVLALLSKPAVVALPLALLGLDILAMHTPPRRALARVTPFLVLAGAWAVFTMVTQPVPEAMHQSLAVWKRPFVAADACLFYLRKALVPTGLAAVYGRVPAAVVQSPLSYAALAGVVGLLIVAARRRGAFAISVLLFAVPLIPVSGLVPFRYQYHSTVADRYFYLSMFGIATAVAFLVREILRRLPTRRNALLSACFGIVVVLCALTFRQCLFWKSSLTLFSHSVAIAPDVALARGNLGLAYGAAGRPQEAIREFEKALQLEPRFAEVHNSLGSQYLKLDQLSSATRHLETAVKLKPDLAAAHDNLGSAYAFAGRETEGIDQYRRAIQLDPRLLSARTNLAIALVATGNPSGAEREARQALALNPAFVTGHVALALSLEKQGRGTEATAAYEKALALDPANAEVRARLNGLRTRGRP
jgi:protein O-mannosyl-transferase